MRRMIFSVALLVTLLAAVCYAQTANASTNTNGNATAGASSIENSTAAPRIHINVPTTFMVESDGCITVPEPSSVYAITGGDWTKPEVAAYLKKVNPFLKEEKRQFNWKNMGPGSGIYVYTDDRICGFDSVEPDVSLTIHSLSAAELAKLRADSEALAKAKSHNFALWIFLGILAIALAVSRFMNGRKERETDERYRSLQDQHSKSMASIDEANEKLLSVLRDNHAAALKAQQAAHESALTAAIANTHALYNPCDGIPVVKGGLAGATPEVIEDAIMSSIYEDRAGENIAFLPFDAALKSNLFRRIGPITFGYMNGTGVEIRNGDRTHATKNLRNVPGYHTRVRFPDGNEVDAYSLQACCNPVVHGDFIRPSEDFTFTPAHAGAEIAPVPPEALITELQSADGKIQVRITGSETAELKEGNSDGTLAVFVDRPTSPKNKTA